MGVIAGWEGLVGLGIGGVVLWLGRLMVDISVLTRSTLGEVGGLPLAWLSACLEFPNTPFQTPAAFRNVVLNRLLTDRFLDAG